MIRLICIGKLKEKFYQDAYKEYEKRLGKYTKFELVELPDDKTDDPIVSRRKEKEKILSVLSDKDYIITMEIEGKMYTSIDFARFIDTSLIHQTQLTFIIGGSYGLDEEIKKLAKARISFSFLTFPHQLFRIMLMEQFYRAFTIIHNEKYHK